MFGSTRRGLRRGTPRAGFKAFAMRRTKARFRPVPQRLTRVQRGFQRTGGFFGRFSGPGAELKFFDLDIDDATVAANGTIAADSVNKIPQGVTEVTRVGRKCTIRSIGWRFNLATVEADGSTDPLNSDTVRVILYLDKQANGATAAVTDILESDDYQSFNNLANKSRFRTLMDRTYTLNVKAGGGNGTNSDWAATRIDDDFFKKVNIPIEFDATTGAITEIKSNNIGVLLLGFAATTTFSSKMRIRFSDV